MFAEIPKKLRKIAVDKAKVLYTGNLTFFPFLRGHIRDKPFFRYSVHNLAKEKT